MEHSLPRRAPTSPVSRCSFTFFILIQKQQDPALDAVMRAAKLH